MPSLFVDYCIEVYQSETWRPKVYHISINMGIVSGISTPDSPLYEERTVELAPFNQSILLRIDAAKQEDFHGILKFGNVTNEVSVKLSDLGLTNSILGHYQNIKVKYIRELLR